ncbi:MAG: AI-2E family transporter [Caldimonas sp.]
MAPEPKPNGILGFDVRAARITWTVALVVIAMVATYEVRRTLFVFVLAVFFSYMIYPLVRSLERWAPKRLSKATSTAVIFALLLLVIAALLALVGPPIADQAAKLSEQLPKLTQDSNVMDRLPLPDWLTPYRDRIVQYVRDHLASGTAAAVPLAKQVGHVALQVAGNLVFVVLIPILAFLLIKDGSAMRERYLAWADGRVHAAFWKHLIDDLDSVLGRYMRALLILSLAAMVAYGIAFSIAGVPFGLLLAFIAGILEFIPVAGPLAACICVLVVAGLSGFDHLLLLAGFFVLYRLFQDYVLNPMLMSDGVAIPPVFVLFGLLAGEELGGIVGIFLSIPVLAIAKIIAARIAHEVRARAAPSA